MKWIRLDCEMDSHPDILAAGYHGTSVFQALLRTSKRFDLGGAIPAKYATPGYLAHQIGIDPNEVDSALVRCVTATLIERDENGNVTVTGWDRHNGEHDIEAVREQTRIRVANWRAEKKRKDSDNVQPGNVTVTQCNDVTGTERDVTEHNGTEQDRTEPPVSPPVGGHPDSSDSVPADPKPIAQYADPFDGESEPKPAKGAVIVAPKPAEITFDTNTGMFVGITDTHRAAWSALKPNADIDEELKTAAVVWLGGKYKDANRFLRNFFTPRKPAWKRQKEEAEREWISFLRTVTAWPGYGADEERKDAYLACLSDRVAYAVEALGGTDRRRCAESVRDSVGYEQERLKRAFLAAFDAFDGGQP